MIKRYHEAPIDIFKKVQAMTDGDYALVHLFETNPKYLQMFKDAVAKGRDVILDNSIFELGVAFDSERYAYWVEELRPTWYIVPDSWKNPDQTIEMFFKFIEQYPDLPGKRIGVAQGFTVEEVTRCYDAIAPHCDMIAINLDGAHTSNIPAVGIPYCVRMSVGRYNLIKDLYCNGVIDESKPHHLLGCGVPQEMLWYPEQWTWIRSVDTCNPVITGMQGIAYDGNLPGLLSKPTQKMCNCMDQLVSASGWSCVRHNIEQFKAFCDQKETVTWTAL